FLIIFIFSCFIKPIFAVPIEPDKIVTLVQPDGNIIKARYFGDEWFNFAESVDGYTILLDAKTKAWVYADLDLPGNLKPTKFPAHYPPPPNIGRYIRPSAKKIKEIISRKKLNLHKNTKTDRFFKDIPDDPLISKYPVKKTGDQKMLIILADFADSMPIGTTEKDWENMFFGNDKSVKKYYNETSYGKFNLIPAEEDSGIKNNGVTDWIRLPGIHPNMGINITIYSNIIVRDAIIAADTYMDFSKFDTNHDGWIGKDELFVVVIVAGYSSLNNHPSIWAHSATLSIEYVPTVDRVRVCEGLPPLDKRQNNYVEMGEWYEKSITQIGTCAHEIGHLLDLPDLYDMDKTSNGIGSWCLMSFGSWNKISEPGDTPSQLSIWGKTRLGWIDPEIIKQNTINKKLHPIEDYQSGIKIWEDNFQNNRYFLLEYRKKTKYDAGLPGEGVLIWHINEDEFENTNDISRLVDLEEADGLSEIDNETSFGDNGDPYPGSYSNNFFDNNSTPNSKDYFGNITNTSVKNFKLDYSTAAIMDIYPRRIKGNTKSYDELQFSWYVYDTGINTVGVKFLPDEKCKLIKIKTYFLQKDMAYTINIYDSISDNNIPGRLLYSQKGENKYSGWKVINLDSTVLIEDNYKPFVEINYQLLNVYHPYLYKISLDYYGSLSGGSYFLKNGIYSKSAYDYNMRAMFSKKPSPPISGFVPANGDKINIFNPEFSWDKTLDSLTSDGENDFKYIIRIDDDGEILNNYKFSYEVGDSSHITPEILLTDKTTWSYSVCTVDEYEIASGWSEMQRFTVDSDELPPQKFLLSAPYKGEETSLNPVLYWEESKDIDPSEIVTYDLYVDDNEDFSSPEIIKIKLNTTTYNINEYGILKDHTFYYWKVKAKDNYNLSTLSDVGYFVTNFQNEPPRKSILKQPVSGKYIYLDDSSLDFSWISTGDPDPYDELHYTLLLSKDSNFNEIVSRIENINENNTSMNVPQEPGIYAWKIITYDNHGEFTESKTLEFVIKDKNISDMNYDYTKTKKTFICFISYFRQNYFSNKYFPEIDILRDKYLICNYFGNFFTKIYYLCTPVLTLKLP
ncbi:M6 family metalloprotease domain-containing protein, partial [Candidatus Desantisbacteria bacterium]|nr:M6 family metalloprotease domain-containing protein [Candidatus Desantisbacteria bacterium]